MVAAAITTAAAVIAASQAAMSSTAVTIPQSVGMPAVALAKCFCKMDVSGLA